MNYENLREDCIDNLKFNTEIKTNKYLRRVVFEKIIEKVPDKYSKLGILLKEDLKKRLEAKRDEYEKKSALSQKKILIMNSSNSMMFKQLHLITGAKCNTSDRFHNDITSIYELKEIIKQCFNIINPVIRAEKDDQTHLNTFEDILKCDYHVFIVSGNSINA